MMLTLAFPAFDPVMIHLGPIPVYWYGIAYVMGILMGWQYALWLARRYVPTLTKGQVDDFMMWALGGIVIGGRLGHVLFFDWARYVDHPWEILMTRKGGMSFHGGLIGVAIALILYCRKNKLSLFRFSDIIATVAPIGICLGRIANFVNGELYGRVTDVSWAMVFPHGGPLPRHPSQLYEAFLEGLLLLIVLHLSWRMTVLREAPGRLTGLFLVGYGAARTLVEFVREPDTFYSLGGIDLTTGQLLSVPLILTGLWFLFRKNQSNP